MASVTCSSVDATGLDGGCKCLSGSPEALAGDGASRDALTGSYRTYRFHRFRGLRTTGSLAITLTSTDIRDTGKNCRNTGARASISGESAFKEVRGIARCDDGDASSGDDSVGHHAIGGRNEMTPSTADDDEQARDHLDDVADGCGCTELWEHLSETREADD